MKIPNHHLPVMPYLIIHDARAFAEFAKSVFGATEQLIVPGDDKTIMHGELRIDEAVIMFADAGDNWKAKPAGMYLYVNDVNKVYDLAMNKGAKSLGAPEKKEYGYTAGFQDEFENQWFIVEGHKE